MLYQGERYHVIAAFAEADRQTADIIVWQLAVGAQLGLGVPFRLWFDDGSEWPDYPEIRIVFLTVEFSELDRKLISKPVEADEARGAEARIIRMQPFFEGIKNAVVLVVDDEDFATDRIWRGDAETNRILRMVMLTKLSGRFKGWLEDPDPEPEPKKDPEPKPEVSRPAWPGIERPSRF